MKKVPPYLKLCEKAIEQLSKELDWESQVEEMLLTACRARYLEAGGDVNGARRSSEAALELAGKVGAKNYAVKLRMMLCHLNMLLDEQEEALVYYVSLLPPRRYSTGHFGWHYKQYVKQHETDLLKYVTKQCQPTL